ncbi:hypothetical protein D3C78_1576180 [compost metagenome]
MQVTVDAREQGAQQAGSNHQAGNQHQLGKVPRQQAIVDQQLGQPRLHQHQQRSAQRQPEQTGNSQTMGAYETVQPVQGVLQALGVLRIDKPGNQSLHHTSNCLSLRYRVARLIPSALAAAETLP